MFRPLFCRSAPFPLLLGCSLLYIRGCQSGTWSQRGTKVNGCRGTREESRKYKHQIQPEYGDEQADAGRDCRTRFARSNSQARTRTGKYSFFSCSVDHVQDWQPYPVDPYSCYYCIYICVTIHTYTHHGDNPLLRPTQGSKSRQKVMRLYKQYGTDQYQNGSSNLLTPYSIESSLDRLGLLSPTHDQRSQQQSRQITFQPHQF